MKKRFFTLAELLIVLVVVGVLVSIVMVNVSSGKEDAFVAMTENNIKNIQSAVDMYQLENNSVLPTTVQPTLGMPSKIDFNLLYPKYLKSLPNLGKFPDQHYWVDSYGKVWGATVDAPKDFNDTGSLIEWLSSDKAQSYNVYEITPKNISLSKVYNVNIGKPSNVSNEKVSRFQIPKPKHGFLITAIDEYGFETAPVGSTYKGTPEDWFNPLLSKEGAFTIEFGENSLMYWDRFWVAEDKPEGTDIQYTFSVSDNKEDWSEYTSDFYSLPSSKNIRIKVTMIGSESKKPSLLDMRVDFHFENQAIKKEKPILLGNEELPVNFPSIEKSSDGTIDFENAHREIYTFNPAEGQRISNLSKPYSDFYQEMHIYTLNEANGTFIHHSSFSNIPADKKVYISIYTSGVRTSPSYGGTGSSGSSGSNTYHHFNPPTIEVSKEIVETKKVDLNETPLPENMKDVLDIPEVNDVNWKNIDGFNLFFFAGAQNNVDWIKSTIVDSQPAHSRIKYYYMSNTDSDWSEPYDDISKVPNSRALKVAIVLQVENDYYGKVEPTFTSMAISHDKGQIQGVEQEGVLMLLPHSPSNPSNYTFDTFTPINWNYIYEDSFGRSNFLDLEWKLNGKLVEEIPSILPAGSQIVSLRIKDLKGNWTEWVDNSILISSSRIEFNSRIQTYSVPNDGTYMVEVFGARGGSSGQSGSYVRGEVVLSAGSTLTVYSGEIGSNRISNDIGSYRAWSGAGGGGSSAILLNQQLLIEASGGNGQHGAPNSYNETYGLNTIKSSGGFGYHFGGTSSGVSSGRGGGSNSVSPMVTNSHIQTGYNTNKGLVIISRIK